MDDYEETMLNRWDALVNKALHPNGFLGYMQGTGKEPSASQPVTYESVPDFEDFGLGAFLLAASEVYKRASQYYSTTLTARACDRPNVEPAPQ